MCFCAGRAHAWWNQKRAGTDIIRIKVAAARRGRKVLLTEAFRSRVPSRTMASFTLRGLQSFFGTFP